VAYVDKSVEDCLYTMLGGHLRHRRLLIGNLQDITPILFASAARETAYFVAYDTLYKSLHVRSLEVGATDVIVLTHPDASWTLKAGLSATSSEGMGYRNPPSWQAPTSAYSETVSV
jgi:hypothetical protein